MLRFLLRRLVGMVLVLVAVSVLSFAIFNVVPAGSTVDRIAPRGASEVTKQRVSDEWDLDKPVHVQYVRTMEKVVTGDVISYEDETDVDAEIRRGAPRTFALAGGAAVLWLVLGVGLGLLGALTAGRLADRVTTFLALVGVSLPVFWVGALASYYLGYRAELFPAGGYVTIAEGGLWEWVAHLVLPWLVLSTLFVGVYSRVLRASVLDTMSDDYVRTARAKGIGERRVMGRHVLRNALVPVVTLWGLDVGMVLGGGAVLTETVFELDGVGEYFARSVDALDVPAVLTLTMFAAFFIVVLNTIVDLLYAVLDPRIRMS